MPTNGNAQCRRQACRHGCIVAPSARAAAGSMMVARKPAPGWLSSSSQPPCSSAKAFTSVRPRPAPLECWAARRGRHARTAAGCAPDPPAPRRGHRLRPPPRCPLRRALADSVMRPPLVKVTALSRQAVHHDGEHGFVGVHHQADRAAVGIDGDVARRRPAPRNSSRASHSMPPASTGVRRRS